MTGGFFERHRPELPSTIGFLVTTAAAVALAVTYWRGGQPQLEGLFLAIAFGGLCFGMVRWANDLLDDGPQVQERHELAGSEADRGAVEREFERGGEIERRSLLLRTLGLAGAALGAAALFPLRSLGPRPGRALLETPWRNGLKLVNDQGVPVNVADVPLGGLVTVFPEGSPGSADGQAVLVRVEEGSAIRPRQGRGDWSPQGFIAYSKICTHAGCPVGLYEAQAHQLLCPCHQSTFDVLDGARPVFGPAAASLPQLPLRIEADGTISARGDFSDPVGPSFWRRG
jgi:ubiquinol-cytochrome c reductase iron-sulfur subunit